MRWYREHGRHNLPWRHTRDPYSVLVSEVMLQQTQVERVLPYYERWLARWPSIEALAAAPASEVIREWRGLGYNRRALNLHRAAVAVSAQGSGLPTGERELRRLPGVGSYTAAAVRCFAGGANVVVADTNITRVAVRVVCGAQTVRDVSARSAQAALIGMLPVRGARDHNLALMDLGAMVCTARTPKCAACPVRGVCAWRAAGSPLSGFASRPSERFESTARFARGRIVDALRERPTSTAALRGMFPTSHAANLDSYLEGLVKDGLVIALEDETWSLPA